MAGHASEKSAAAASNASSSKAPSKTALYRVSYTYDRKLLHLFCRVHLWYHKRQHPLFLAVPGVFLAASLAFYVISHILRHEAPDGTRLVTVFLIAVFMMFLLWLGFVSPRVFESTMLKNLDDPSKLKVRIDFYPDRLRAENRLAVTDLPYGAIRCCYVTKSCLFLYISDAQALIVPFSSIPEKDRDSFQQFIQEKLAGKIRVRKYAEVF